MISLFRTIAFLEGVSYVLLIFIAVPIKYYGNEEKWVKMLGMPHGVLFISYVLLAVIIQKKMNWKLWELCIVLICSLLPFGTFYADKKYFKQY